MVKRRRRRRTRRGAVEGCPRACSRRFLLPDTLESHALALRRALLYVWSIRRVMPLSLNHCM